MWIIACKVFYSLLPPSIMINYAMFRHRSAQTHSILQKLLQETSLPFYIKGNCMSPLLKDGATVTISRSRFYWPGDILLVFPEASQAPILHRFIGCYWSKGEIRFLTQADTAAAPDSSCLPTQIGGRLSGGECSPLLVKIPLQHRLWAVGRFFSFASLYFLRKKSWHLATLS